MVFQSTQQVLRHSFCVNRVWPSSMLAKHPHIVYYFHRHQLFFNFLKWCLKMSSCWFLIKSWQSSVCISQRDGITVEFAKLNWRGFESCQGFQRSDNKFEWYIKAGLHCQLFPIEGSLDITPSTCPSRHREIMALKSLGAQLTREQLADLIHRDGGSFGG